MSHCNTYYWLHSSQNGTMVYPDTFYLGHFPNIAPCHTKSTYSYYQGWWRCHSSGYTNLLSTLYCFLDRTFNTDFSPRGGGVTILTRTITVSVLLCITGYCKELPYHHLCSWKTVMVQVRMTFYHLS